MNFKYCVIGDTCYEYNKNFKSTDSKEPEEEVEKRRLIREKLDIKEIGPKFSTEYVYGESKVLNEELNYEIVSKSNPSVKINLKTDKDVINEYWTAITLANECNVEKLDDESKIYTVMVVKIGIKSR